MSTPAKKGLIGAIKAGQAHLGWDDVTYRSVLARLCGGKTSSTKCTLSDDIILVTGITERVLELGSRKTVDGVDHDLKSVSQVLGRKPRRTILKLVDIFCKSSAQHLSR